MAVLHLTHGRQSVVVDQLRLSLIEVTEYGVSIGVSDREIVRSEGVQSPELSEVCRNRSCYFWFGKNGRRMLVVRCRKGKSIVLSGTRRLTVVDVEAKGISVAISSTPNKQLSFAGTTVTYAKEVTAI